MVRRVNGRSKSFMTKENDVFVILIVACATGCGNGGNVKCLYHRQ
jgi:hypothetical protein